ncbi:DNA-binding response regulator [Nocardioides sp. zg-1228]|uniref:helix-turn-helix transcriptional regulator n=1 Tax=Nocardioides sp. zg-1228 TaxID=2763008 RepID=UPI0016425FBA|nr:DNA-binding response regulator [Nocardioides sp. zg-1228]MBC2931736.1 DNA-binding response regulator [Nocardioides sp. zg-1228]QSF57321.1 DNA-binding response regulator [Nocardioides sp. zg-1228]
MPGDPSSVLVALGLERRAEQLYFRVAPVSGHTVAGVAQVVQARPDQLLRDLAPLIERGLVVVADDRVVVPSLAEAVSELVLREARTAASSAGKLAELSLAVPHLVAAAARPERHHVSDVQPLDGELSSGGDPFELLQVMMRTSRGDMLWLRPDAWAMPRESRVSEMLGEAMSTGRRSRAIYPARALTEAPDALRVRASLGEQVRILSEVPTRMFIFGDTHAVLPEPIGFTDDPRVHVRQRSIVAALTMWFESLWARAAPMREVEAGKVSPDGRQFLLEQLMAGSTDEVIARKLGIGLRTVRRRVAALMTELGVDTRFQAGVEAVRRGWL